MTKRMRLCLCDTFSRNSKPRRNYCKKTLAIKHMSVMYDRSKDCLVYNRTLQDGAGDSMYGLEVCKSLNLPFRFSVKCSRNQK